MDPHIPLEKSLESLLLPKNSVMSRESKHLKIRINSEFEQLHPRTFESTIIIIRVMAKNMEKELTIRERLKSALYPTLKKRTFEICVGGSHEKLFRLHLTKTQYSSYIT